jgi:hypothetical protein
MEEIYIRMVATMVVDDVVFTYFVDLSSGDLNVRGVLEKRQGGYKEGI